MKVFTPILVTFFLITSCGFSKKRSAKYLDEGIKNAPYDAIIVPGVPYDGETWQSVMKIRVYWSKYLYDQGITENIIYSGNAVYTEYSEAKTMAEYGKALNIPHSSIFLDTLAEHSVENVYYSYRVAKANGLKRIALATDPFQCKSMRKFIKKHELPIDLLPIVFDTLRTFERPEPVINPELSREENFVSIKDRESFFTRLSGTFGKQIMWHKEDLPNEHLIKKYERKDQLVDP